MSTITSKIISKLGATDFLVVGISGGSGSGKSYYSVELTRELTSLGIEAIVINQDDFAIGRDFKDKKTSKYKWDDPANYRLDECLKVIYDLKAGKSVSYVAYNLLTHEPSDQKNIQNIDTSKKTVVILEGILAWYGPMENIVDLKVYIDVNFYTRFLLRANRNINHIKNIDLDGVIQQYFTHVMFAEHDILQPMWRNADVIIKRDVDLSIIKTSVDESEIPDIKHRNIVYADSQSKIMLYEQGGRDMIQITVLGTILFNEPIYQASVDAIKTATS